jgi:2-polyprenyl-3-methyl-5-hydroxy-6-metoxy-1,4-benzoquinol methylase
MNQQDLNYYFSTHWRGQFNQYLHSGLNLTKKIRPEEWVLDVGCGANIFKSLIANLVGIDPAFDQADVITTIEDFKTDRQFDVAFCLGSINFGTEETIKNQIKCVVNLLKPQSRIYWRCNPGLKDHGNKECYEINFFPWSPLLLKQYAQEFGFDVVDIKEDFNNRIYCEWVRSNT